jgi:ABC-type molybdate transport system substrate-binding protein
MRLLAGAVVALMMISSVTRADDLVVYGAGSLREAIGQIASAFGRAQGLTVRTEFGPSGRMRERIEKGEARRPVHLA